MTELGLNELKDVSGGFAEKNKELPTYNMNIECPNCHSKKATSFSNNVLYDQAIGSTEYHCQCGCSFIVYKGQVIKKNNFIKLCKDNGISYSFM